MITFDEIKQYLWKIVGVLGVVLLWIGLTDGIGELPYLKDPLISLIVGIILFTLSGIFFKDSSPLWSAPKGIQKVLKEVHQHPFKHEFHFRYEDKTKKKDFLIGAQFFHKIEKDFAIFRDPDNKEVFIPVNRIKEVLRGEKTHWKKGAKE